MHRKLIATASALVIVGTFSFFTAAQAATIKKDVQVNSPLQDVQTKISSNSVPLEKTLTKPTPSKPPVKKVAKAPTPSPTPSATPAPVGTPVSTPAPTVAPQAAPQPVVEPVQPVQPIPVAAASTSCGDNQYAAYIYGMESGGKIPGNCNPTAQNAGGCLGIGQACPGSKLTAVCPNLDYACENAFFTEYAIARYGSWEGAYAFWLSHSWW